MYDQSCSTSDPKRSWSVKIDQIENVTVKKTLAGFSLSLGFVCKCVRAKNVGSSLYLDLKKGFVVAAITLWTGLNAGKYYYQKNTQSLVYF